MIGYDIDGDPGVAILSVQLPEPSLIGFGLISLAGLSMRRKRRR